MSYYQQYFGRFYADQDFINFSIGGHAITLTQGWYYTTQYSGEGTQQFCQMMQAAIRAEGTYPNALVTYSMSTGKITITSNDGGSTTLVFTDAALAMLLGFSGDRGVEALHVANYSPRYSWRPSLPISKTPGDVIYWWDSLSTTTLDRSSDGSVGSVIGNNLYEGSYGYDILPQADCVVPSTGTINQDFQSFWLDVIAKGQPIRVYPDRTDETKIKTGFFGIAGEEVGSLSSNSKRYIKDVNSFFGIDFDMVKYQ